MWQNAACPIEEGDGGGPAIAAAIYGNGIPANGATDQQMAEAKRAAEEWLRGLVLGAASNMQKVQITRFPHISH